MKIRHPAVAGLLAAELKLELRSYLATNGVLSNAQIDWVVAHLRGVSVSCDGLPAVHDRCRRTPSGKGSSQRVAHTMRRFDAAKFSYGIRLTATAEKSPCATRRRASK